MSKIGHTKSKILKLISSGNKTSSDISKELKLNPSTVSQHIQELKELGAIEEVRNEHFRKWKYFRLNTNFDISEFVPSEGDSRIESVVRNKTFITSVAALGVIIVVAYVLLAGRSVNVLGYNLVQVALTDPPSVPPGTQNLYINYSSVAIHVSGNGTSEWIESDTSGTVDLLSLINTSKIIANFDVPSNLNVDAVNLTIDSEYIVINSTRHNVVLRQGQISSEVDSNGTNGSEVLVDLAPTVIPMYINGKEIFVMVSQVGSVLLNQAPMHNGLGNLSKLNSAQLNGLTHLATKINITNTSLAVQNGSVQLSLTLKNTGRRSFVLRDLLVLGNQYLQNGTGSYTPILPVSVSSNHMGVQFLIDENGTLDFADPQYIQSSLERINQVYLYATEGYVLAPNSSVTFSYSGKMAVSNSSDIALINGTRYKITVLGDLISSLSRNVTAT